MLTPKHSRTLLLVTIMLLILASGCTSLSTIPGDVNDPSGKTPITPALSTLRGVINFKGVNGFAPPATVHIGSHRIVTNNGQFTVTGLEASKYDIRITADHFHTYEGQVTINSESVMLNVTMDLRFTPYEMELFARLVWAEAIGEPKEGQIAVAASVLNRLADPRYPNTLEEVIMETVVVGGKKYYQYSPVLDGRIWELNLDLESDKKQYEKAMEAVYAAIAGQDPSLGATGFYNPDRVSPDPNLWVRQQPPTIKIGNHQFFL